MKYNYKKRKKKISALILLLVITIGYALLSTTLKINGVANIKSNTWDIHFENVQPNQSSTVTAETPSITDNATKVSYTVELSLPGDFYEFTVDAVNDGSVNGIISDIEHKVYLSTDLEHTTTLPSYIKYSIVYDGTTTVPGQNDILEAGDSITYRIRIEYDENASSLVDEEKEYVIVDEINYAQTKSSNHRNIEDIINEIEADPDRYRNVEQSPTNLDIGLDEDGNVINLDMWYDNENSEESEYVGPAYWLTPVYNENDYPTIERYYITLGDTGNNSIYTPATAIGNIVNGEITTPIPAYIKLANEAHFYPVEELDKTFSEYTFCDRNDCDVIDEDSNIITKIPKLPNTIKIIGDKAFYNNNITSLTIPENIIEISNAAFSSNNLTSLTIPRNVIEIGREAFGYNEIQNLSFQNNSLIKSIESEAFSTNNISGNLILPQSLEYIGYNAFEYNEIQNLSFQNNSSIKRIDSGAFTSNNISGDLILPQSLEYIGYRAFCYNHLTSVTFPSSTVCDNDAFDSGVTINHNY